MLLQKKTITQNQEIKWNDALTTDLNWKKIYVQIINITIDTKLRSFQYKYLMHILPNNKQLFKYGMIESSLCDFCSMTTESNIHLFWECSYVQPFWNQIRIFFNVKLNTPSENFLTYQSFCNVNINNKTKSNCINCIILLGKYFIFKTKYQKTTPSFNEFKYYLKYKLHIEGLIAEMKGKVDAHEKKWNIFAL